MCNNETKEIVNYIRILGTRKHTHARTHIHYTHTILHTIHYTHVRHTTHTTLHTYYTTLHTHTLTTHMTHVTHDTLQYTHYTCDTLHCSTHTRDTLYDTLHYTLHRHTLYTMDSSSVLKACVAVELISRNSQRSQSLLSVIMIYGTESHIK